MYLSESKNANIFSAAFVCIRHNSDWSQHPMISLGKCGQFQWKAVLRLKISLLPKDIRIGSHAPLSTIVEVIWPQEVVTAQSCFGIQPMENVSKPSMSTAMPSGLFPGIHLATILLPRAWIILYGIRVFSSSFQKFMIWRVFQVKIWDLGSSRCRTTFRAHADSVNSVQFLPFSNTLISGSADKTVILWDARAVSFDLTIFRAHENFILYSSIPWAKWLKPQKTDVQIGGHT